MWLSWLALPALLGLAGAVWGQTGIHGWRRWALLGFTAVNAYTVSFGANLLSEPWFCVFLLAAFVLADRRPAMAGVLMGLAYLTRSAGIVALVTFPLYYGWRREFRRALAFAAGMLPSVAAWTLWVKTHALPEPDLALMYYLDYAGYQLANVGWRDLPVVLWKNADGIVWSLGSLVLPRVFDSWWMRVFTELVGVAMLSGIVRLTRQGRGWCPALYAAASAALLLVWHFPPNERFVYPLFPLAFAGLWTELEHLWRMLRAGLGHRDASQRIAAGLLGAGVAALGMLAVGLNIFMVAIVLPEDFEQHRLRRDRQQPALAWMRQNLPPTASILATRDPLVHLATGFHSISRPVPPRYWYTDDRDAIVQAFATVPAFARQHALDFVYHAGVDFGWAVSDQDRERIDRAIRSHPDLAPVLEDEGATVFRVAPAAAHAADRRRTGLPPAQ
jgi:hypothetical protein